MVNVIYFYAFYMASRRFFENQRELWKVQETFDVRNAKCGVERDEPILLASIQQKFADEGDSETSLIVGGVPDADLGESALDKYK